MRCVLFLVLLGGCSPASDEPGTSSGPPTVPDGCPALPVASPVDDADDVFIGTSLRWTFDAVDPSVTTRMQDINGNPLPGTGAWEETTWVWTPDALLEPVSQYGVELTYCDGEVVVDQAFTTSDLGRPVNDLAGLVGNTYVFDFTDPGFRAIRNLGLDAVGWPFLLFEVTAADASGVDLRMGAVHEDAPTVQDPCWPTTGLEGTIAGAVLSTAETSVALPIGSVEYLTLDGVFTPTGDALVGVRLQYAADARNQDLFTPESVCSSAAIFGEGCVDCPDGSGPWCVFSEFELDEMTVDPTFSVVPATACD